MRVLLVIALLVAMALLVWLTWRLLARLLASGTGEWEPRERTLPNGQWVIELVRPGQEPIEVRRLAGDLDAITFADRVTDARAEALEKASVLNAGGGRRPARRRATS